MEWEPTMAVEKSAANRLRPLRQAVTESQESGSRGFVVDNYNIFKMLCRWTVRSGETQFVSHHLLVTNRLDGDCG